ncbi:hypothetical protein K505DRAFT_356260 [Melanomma pulvis-pyrius CBS 109.77]|uniref:Uncharacterized protein n=1 Tax=Melanomma pulvis-pyrius CBS 109.77 TaxID=1314802 RepID=A0A6A6XU79_9PLEO|nr:hypothetical protein K505DRAFT_356260 [Melanomma pulvis-pyrius CBS 109.77]
MAKRARDHVKTEIDIPSPSDLNFDINIPAMKAPVWTLDRINEAQTGIDHIRTITGDIYWFIRFMSREKAYSIHKTLDLKPEEAFYIYHMPLITERVELHILWSKMVEWGRKWQIAQPHTDAISERQKLVDIMKNNLATSSMERSENRSESVRHLAVNTIAYHLKEYYSKKVNPGYRANIIC